MLAHKTEIMLQNAERLSIVIILTMEILMKAYKGTFKKRNGEIREMFFAKIEDIPEPFISQRVAGTGSERSYPPGMELVWDIEADNFRLFNHATAESPLQEVNIDENHFI